MNPHNTTASGVAFGSSVSPKSSNELSNDPVLCQLIKRGFGLADKLEMTASSIDGFSGRLGVYPFAEATGLDGDKPDPEPGVIGDLHRLLDRLESLAVHLEVGSRRLNQVA